MTKKHQKKEIKTIFTMRLHGKKIKILKGIRSRNGEFFVRIYGQKKRVSVWKLAAPVNSWAMENFFQEVFGVSYREASQIHIAQKKDSAIRRAAKNGRDALRRQLKKFKEEGLVPEKITW